MKVNYNNGYILIHTMSMMNTRVTDIGSVAKIAVCILFYEKVDQTIECIRSFLPSGVTIYILNNGSSKGSRITLGKFLNGNEQVVIFDSDVNLGVAVGRNYLISHSTEEWLLFVDNDITITIVDWSQRFNKYIDAYGDVEVFIPCLFNLPEKVYTQPVSFRLVDNKVVSYISKKNRIINSFPGGASLIHRNLFNRLGLYDDALFTGWEDFELSIRGIRSGNPIKAMYVNDIKMVHNHHPVVKDEDRMAVLKRYDTELLEKSYKRIYEKHQVIIDNNWKPWAIKQVTQMMVTSGRTKIDDCPGVFYKVKNELKKLLNL